jgi:ribosomal protein S3
MNEYADVLDVKSYQEQQDYVRNLYTDMLVDEYLEEEYEKSDRRSH